MYNCRSVITRTFTTVDELQGYRPRSPVVGHNEHATTVQEKRAAIVGSRLFPTTSHNLLDLRNKDIEHLINRLQLGNL